MKFKTLSRKLHKEHYPQLFNLGVPVYLEPISHVKSKDLGVGLKGRNLDREKFSEYFGCQTCPYDSLGRPAYYPWDVEAVLEKMINNKLVGSQKYWD